MRRQFSHLVRLSRAPVRPRGRGQGHPSPTAPPGVGALPSRGARGALPVGIATVRTLRTLRRPQCGCWGGARGAGTAVAVDHYAALGLGREATVEEVKAAYIAIARTSHPDVAETPEAAAAFNAAAAAHEVLGCPDARAEYDLTLAADTAAGAAAEVRRETMLELELRTLIEAGDVDGAIAMWGQLAEAPIAVLLHIILYCTRRRRVPADLSVLLSHLHKAEESVRLRDREGEEGVTAGTALVQFHERKTKAYNDLIRLVDTAGTRDQLFEVLDAMDDNNIDVDMETWMVLEEVFAGRGGERDNPNRGKGSG